MAERDLLKGYISERVELSLRWKYLIELAKKDLQKAEDDPNKVLDVVADVTKLIEVSNQTEALKQKIEDHLNKLKKQ